MASTGQIGQSGASHPGSPSSNPGRRLDSWKAIAQYLDRDVRSVQRWERDRGLPVHRLPGQKGGAVFAYEGELDDWLRSGRAESSASISPGSDAAQVAAADAQTQQGSTWRGMVIATLLAAVTVAAVLALALLPNRPAGIPASAYTIAVLPMQNLSPDSNQDYFVDGFTEELTTDLAQVRALRVISRTSTMIYKGSKKSLPQIAGELHVRYVLEGSVVREGNRVRVTAQLIDAAADTHLWARTYDSDVKDILDIQGQISRAIADDVSLDLSPAERERLSSVPSINPEAHDLYLKASYAFAQQSPDSIRQSLALYKQATDKDPSFAMAYVGIAQAEAALLQITAEGPELAIAHEKQNLTKALALDPHLGDAHGMLASLAYYQDWDWPRAEHEFELALAEGARAPTEQRYGSALATRGRFEEATAHLQTAMELDPLGNSPRVNQFFGLYFQRKYPEARNKLEEILATNPNFLAGHLLLGLVAFEQHDCTETATQAEWAAKRFPSPVAEFELAVADACRGDIAAGRKHLEAAAGSKPPAFASPYQLALGYALTGDRDTALSYLKRSADAREPQILYLKFDPMFDEMRSDERYIALEKRVGLLP